MRLIRRRGNRELVQVMRGHYGWHYEWRVYREDNTYWVSSSFFLGDKQLCPMCGDAPAKNDSICEDCTEYVNAPHK